MFPTQCRSVKSLFTLGEGGSGREMGKEVERWVDMSTREGKYLEQVAGT